ncbi:hypothetical protein [Leisingera thetidis]|uniref:hypothetical protein n=1 Tax=Leisingera thetidis TaxID=2930199 RepID=UPI0021F72ED2|nr:hypothetical protein [Leisingera thetidis]
MLKLVKILAAALPLGTFAMPSLAQDFDTSGFSELTAVHITGKGSKTVIVTDPGRSPGVTIRDEGANGLLCAMTAELSQQDGVLTVDVRRKGLSLGVRCDLTVELVIPQPVAVAVDQPMAVLELTGAFKAVDIDAAKLTVTFEGHAAQFGVKGDMGVIDAVFATGSGAAASIDIDVAKLVANVGFTDGAGLDYRVTAPVAMFSHRFPQTPGAAGKMRINSKVLKGSVYPVAAPT